jgi:hypothetical protein
MKLHGDVVKVRLLAAVLASVAESEGLATPAASAALRGKPLIKLFFT